MLNEKGAREGVTHEELQNLSQVRATVWLEELR